MSRYRVIIDNKIIANNVKIAASFLMRLVGLINTKRLESGAGLLLKNCNQIHTFGMKFDIDVIFLSQKGEILHIEENLSRGKISKYIKEANQVLELKAGSVNKHNVKLNETIIFECV